ncbi:MAG: hypothetical protein ACFFD4_01015 [Candidatus Odinarchaeota archaeon]
MIKEDNELKEKHSTIRVRKETLESLSELKKRGRFSSMDQLAQFFLYIIETRIQKSFQVVVEEFFERMEPEEETETAEKEIPKISLQDPSPAEQRLEDLGGIFKHQTDEEK